MTPTTESVTGPSTDLPATAGPGPETLVAAAWQRYHEAAAGLMREIEASEQFRTVLPADLAVGDILCTPVTGAYGHSTEGTYTISLPDGPGKPGTMTAEGSGSNVGRSGGGQHAYTLAPLSSCD